MTGIRRRVCLFVALGLSLGGCVSFESVPGPVRDVVPRLSGREVLVIDSRGRATRLVDVRLERDSIVGIAVTEGRPLTLAAADVAEIRVLKPDPVTTLGLSAGVMAILIGAAASAALVSRTR
jgi:hypothetical protein